MQAVLDFINKYHYDIFIPLTALAVLRIIVCRAQLKKIASLREKKGAYHAVGGNYTEIGAWLGTLPGFVLALAAPKLWYAGLVLAVIGGILLGKAGKKKGAELDDIYREVALELKGLHFLLAVALLAGQLLPGKKSGPRGVPGAAGYELCGTYRKSDRIQL